MVTITLPGWLLLILATVITVEAVCSAVNTYWAIRLERRRSREHP